LFSAEERHGWRAFARHDGAVTTATNGPEA
jgi:hypothetical protein